MALVDIQKRSAEERKREKRLVHLTNGLARDYLDSEAARKKPKADRATAEHVVKSLLDYLFFEERKELRELNGNHIRQFLRVHAPRRLQIAAESARDVPAMMSDFLRFLDATGHIKNGEPLCAAVKEHGSAFVKSLPPAKKTGTTKKATAARKPAGAKKTASAEENKLGRNDPCPCGSGKKYKKCCGQQ